MILICNLYFYIKSKYSSLYGFPDQYFLSYHPIQVNAVSSSPLSYLALTVGGDSRNQYSEI